MESGLTMATHAALIGVVLFVLMRYGLKQSRSVAEDRSVLLAALALVYMVLWGHKMPGKINPRLRF